MRKKIFRFLFLLLVLAQSNYSFASHLFGGELLYTHVSDNTYKVTLTLYGDCGAGDSIFQSLYYITPVVELRNGGIPVNSITLINNEAGTEISPVCTSQLSNTKCNGGSLPGVRRFAYSQTITLPYRSDQWSFVFSGNTGNKNYGAGRSGNITNVIFTNNNSIIQLKATLNNLGLVDNSSPAYSSIPTPYYCINLNEQYNQGAIDADGDSLSFDLVPATDGNTDADVDYIAPYSATEPMAAQPGSFSFNTLNGQMLFVPSMTQDALVVCKVSEYRKGILVGTSEREMTFIVLNNCTGTPPATSLANVSGGTVTGSNVINICVGTPHLSFNIVLDNPDADNTMLAASTLPDGSALTISNNNTANPGASFDWNTSNIPSGVYTFYLSVNNDHCPLANRLTVAYTINITPYTLFSYNVLLSTQCIHEASLQYDLKYGFSPRTLTISQGGNLVKTYTDSIGSIIDSLPAGTYTAIASSFGGQCGTTSTFTIADSGDLPVHALTNNYCVNGPSSAINITPVATDALITWYAANNTLLYYPPVPDTRTAGIQSWYYTEQYRLCNSGKVPVTAVVHSLPVPVIQAVSRPASICLGDTIYLQATGGVTYVWTPKDQVLTDDSGRLYTCITTPVVLQLQAIDSFGCTDSTNVIYKDIQYCCIFSYPNAFTPNGDGRNDGFGIVTYGNLVQYNLIIYNRWGQQVFHTSDPREYWDGTFNGTPCDMGTYVYYFKAQCLTGNKEEAKGDVILIR